MPEADFSKNIVYEAQDGTFEFHHSVDIKPRPKDFALHYENGYEIFMFIRGKGQYNIEGSRYSLEPFCVLIMNTNEFHMLDITDEQPYERAVIKVKTEFLPPFLYSGVDLYRAFRYRKLGHNNKISSEISIKNGLPQLFEKLSSRCAQNTPEGELLAKCAIIEILSAINEIFLTDLSSVYPAGNDKITAVLDYINSNLNEHLSLDDISDRFFITKYHLCRIFKDTTGFTVNKYITYKRILMADGLMQEGYNPTQACFMSGFNDYSNFYKAYKKLTGHTPKNAAKR